MFEILYDQEDFGTGKKKNTSLTPYGLNDSLRKISADNPDIVTMKSEKSLGPSKKEVMGR